MSPPDSPSGEAHAFPRPGESRLQLLLLAVILLIGIGVRARPYFLAPPLWLDEAMVSLNIMQRGYLELLKPLDYEQAAPPGFLWLAKLSTQIFGNHERALRLFPFLASIATLPLLYLLAKRMLGVPAALVALLLYTLSPEAVEYAFETKQYAFDPLAVVLVLLSAAGYLESGASRRALLGLAVVGTTTLFFSHAVVFVTAGVGVSLLGWELWGKRYRELAGLSLAGGFVLAAGIVNYVFLLRPILSRDFLVDFHRRSYPALATGAPSEIWAMMIKPIEMFEDPLGITLPVLGALVFLIGLYMLRQKSLGIWSVFLSVPLVMLVVAAVLDRYSFFNRFLLFTMPMLAIGIAAGLEGLLGSSRRPVFFAGCLLALLVVGETARQRMLDPEFWIPDGKEDLPVLLDYVAERLEPGDVVLPMVATDKSFWFYTKWGRYREPFSIARLPEFENYEQAAETLDGEPRVWIVSSFFRDRWPDSRDILTDIFDQRGIRRDQFADGIGVLYLYDLSD